MSEQASDSQRVHDHQSFVGQPTEGAEGEHDFMGAMGVELNHVGDVLLDSATIQVLAENGRYELLERLRKTGPSTADELAASAEQLAALASAGLVTGPDEAQRWAAVGRGLFLDIPADPEGHAAARKLVGIMLLDGADAPQRWAEYDSPRLEPDWFSAAGRISVRVALTPDELNDLQAQFERILEPYVNRSANTAEGNRDVRILSYFLPSAE